MTLVQQHAIEYASMGPHPWNPTHGTSVVVCDVGRALSAISAYSGLT